MEHRPVNQRARIHIVQAGGMAFGAILLLTHPVLTGNAHEFIEMIGFALVLVCIAGRLWSILYVGSRKNLELVTSGPYSMTRNPLYFFSTLGAAGVGLIHGSIIVAVALGALACLVLIITANKEADHLKALFGPQYEAYARRTPMFWPNPLQYRDSVEMVFSPKALKRTFFDALFFLLAFPAIEAIEYFQGGEYLPIFMRVF